MTYQPIDIAAFIEKDSPKNGTHKPVQKAIPVNQVETDVEHAVAQLESRGVDITSNHSDWIKTGYAFASLGETGRSFYHRVCAMYPGYDSRECDKKYDYQLRKYDGRTNIASFFQYCKDEGINISSTAQREIDKQPKAAKAPAPAAVPVGDVQGYIIDARVDFSEELTPPPVCLEIEQAGHSSIIGTLGNFSLVIGKAKSRKSFLITILMAAAISSQNVLDIFKGTLPTSKRVVQYFDTEQGRYHVQKAAKRVLHLAGTNNSQDFRAYSLRKYNPQERLQIIEEEIYSTPGIGLVVIDGVRDLITSINDEDQATMLASKLLKWTEELGIHIICVLHQNKGDNNARGHVGSEMTHKAETVASTAKDAKNKEVTIVEAEYCREKEFEAFAFDIDNLGIPQIVDNWSPKQKFESAKKMSYLPPDVSISTHCEVLKLAFDKEEKLGRSQLHQNLKYALSKHNITIGDNKVKDYITFYSQEKLILQQGKAGTKSSHYILNILPG